MGGAYTALAGFVAVAHFAYLAVLVFGSVAALRWRRLLVLHLGAVAWGVGAVVFRYDCPLTSLELRLRELAGMSSYDDGFIRHFLHGELFPNGSRPSWWP